MTDLLNAVYSSVWLTWLFILVCVGLTTVVYLVLFRLDQEAQEIHLSKLQPEVESPLTFKRFEEDHPLKVEGWKELHEQVLSAYPDIEASYATRPWEPPKKPDSTKIRLDLEHARTEVAKIDATTARARSAARELLNSHQIGTGPTYPWPVGTMGMLTLGFLVVGIAYSGYAPTVLSWFAGIFG